MPETPEAIRGLADTMITRFTPPSFVPGCEVKSIGDIDEYTTNNGWIEVLAGGDNQQRVRYYGTPQGVGVGDFVDVEYFPTYKLYRVFGATLGGTASAGGLRVSKVWESDFGAVALQAGADGKITIFEASYGGGAPNINADNLVIESSGKAGISILTPATERGAIMFGDPGSTFQGQFRYDHNLDVFQVVAGGRVKMSIESGGNVVVTDTPPTALGKLHVDQESTLAAIPTLYLDQADVDEPFTKYVGSAAAVFPLTRSIVAEADVTTATRQGFVKIEIEDVGNQVTDQDYFLPFYTLA